MNIDFWGLSETRKVEVYMINNFDKFPMKGKVDIKNSERIFCWKSKNPKNKKTKYYLWSQISGKNDKKSRFYI